MKALWMCVVLAAVALGGCAEGNDSGGGAAGPQILVSVAQLSLGSTLVGTAGTVTTYEVSAGRLAGNLVITAPPGVEVRASGGVFGAGLSLTPDANGAVPATIVEARISAAATAGQAFGVIGHTSPGAATGLGLSGSVLAVPGIQLSVSTLALGSTTAGIAGTVAGYDVSATALGGNLTIAAPSGTEVRLAGGAFAAAAVVTPDSSGNVATTAVEIRVSAGAPAGAVVGQRSPFRRGGLAESCGYLDRGSRAGRPVVATSRIAARATVD